MWRIFKGNFVVSHWRILRNWVKNRWGFKYWWEKNEVLDAWLMDFLRKSWFILYFDGFYWFFGVQGLTGMPLKTISFTLSEPKWFNASFLTRIQQTPTTSTENFLVDCTKLKLFRFTSKKTLFHSISCHLIWIFLLRFVLSSSFYSSLIRPNPPPIHYWI